MTFPFEHEGLQVATSARLLRKKDACTPRRPVRFIQRHKSAINVAYANNIRLSRPMSSESSSSTPPMSVSTAARQAILAALLQRGKGIGVRLCASQSGPSGLSFWLEFADAPVEGDLVFQFGDIQLLAQPRHLPLLNELVIDYVKTEDAEGFQIGSPRLCRQCGCESGGTA